MKLEEPLAEGPPDAEYVDEGMKLDEPAAEGPLVLEVVEGPLEPNKVEGAPLLLEDGGGEGLTL